MSKIGDYVQSRRLALGLTQEQLEELSGLSQNYISQVENGKIERPGTAKLEQLARGLDVTVDDLKVAMGYVVQVDRGVAWAVQGQSASASATVRYGRDTIERMFTENRDELTDEDWQQIAAIIERRQQARDGG